MSAPLKKGQKAYLAQLARRAFNLACARARGAGEVLADGGPSDPALRDANQWRHDQVARACGKLGLRCCGQDDYKLVEAHFLELLGDHGAAFEALTRAATERRRVAEYKVIEACQQAGVQLSYADKICRNQNGGAGLQDPAVDASALWRLVFTIRNRGRARKAKAIL